MLSLYEKRIFAFEQIPKILSGKEYGTTHSHKRQGPQDPPKTCLQKIGLESPIQTPYFKSIGDFTLRN